MTNANSSPQLYVLSPLLIALWGFDVTSLPNSLHREPYIAQSQSSSNQQDQAAFRILQQGIQQMNGGQTQQALESFQQALELFRRSGNRQGESYALVAIGRIHARVGQLERAREAYQDALEIAQVAGDRPSEGVMLNNIGTIYESLGQYQSALGYYEQALALAREIGDRRGEGLRLNNIGFIYSSLGQYQAALGYYEQALALAREIGDREGEGVRLNNIGRVYSSLGQYQSALGYYEQAIAIAQQIGDRIGEGIMLNNIGGIYESLGQYREGLDSYEQSLAIAQEIDDRQGIGESLNSIGAIYRSLGQYQAALGYYEQSLAIRQEIGNRDGEGDSLNNIGAIYESLGQYQAALGYFEQSLAVRREIGDRRGEGDSLGNIGIIYSSLGQYQAALDYSKQSLEISQEIGDRQGEGVMFNNIGFIYDNLEQYQEASVYYEQSLAILQEIGERAGEASTLNNLGVNSLIQGNAVQAETYLFAAIDNLESLRARDLSEDQRISLVETQLDAYRYLQLALLSQNKVIAALEIAERSRARVFLEELAFRLNRETDESLLQAPIPDIAQIRQIAREQNATLVEYSIFRNEALYSWVVQPTGEVTLRSVDLQEQSLDILSLVDSTRTSIGISRLVSWGEDEPIPIPETVSLNARLQELHQLLIDPIADLLPTDPNQSVIFIPQDELFLVPFAALQDIDGSYLIDRHTILTAASIQVLASTRAQQQQVERANLQESLVVGDPEMPGLALIPGEDPIYLDPLPGAQREALEIANILGTEPLLGSTATKSIVIEQMVDARVIHLATHGILDESQGLNGGVVLAADGTGEFNDGLLTAAEIAQMDLNAEMVVLSACNTGQGRITGDGVIGLSRSLILAGVPSVVVSLWAVPDAPTGELMVEFYRQLETTENKAQALRQAMLNMREIYPAPLNWAAFTIIGETE